MSQAFLNLFTPERLQGTGRSRFATKNSVCHEDAFRYLLQAEAKRSQRSGQGYHILLVYRREPEGSVTPMHAYVSAVVLDALATSVRETDYIGWYRQGHIIGSVLTVVDAEAIGEVQKRIYQRVSEALHARLGWEESKSFQIVLCREHELQAFEPAAKKVTVQRGHS